MQTRSIALSTECEYGVCVGFGASLGTQGCPQTGLCTLPVGISAEISASCTTHVANPMLFLSVSCQPRLAERFMLSSRSQLLADAATTLSRVPWGPQRDPRQGARIPFPPKFVLLSLCRTRSAPGAWEEADSSSAFLRLFQGTRHRRVSSEDVSPPICTIHQRDKAQHIYLQSAS